MMKFMRVRSFEASRAIITTRTPTILYTITPRAIPQFHSIREKEREYVLVMKLKNCDCVSHFVCVYIKCIDASKWNGIISLCKQKNRNCSWVLSIVVVVGVVVWLQCKKKNKKRLKILFKCSQRPVANSFYQNLMLFQSNSFTLSPFNLWNL